LSSERVYFRLVRMSCVDKAERLILSSPVAGYIVDEDNKLGLRGEVVRRQGALLAKAALANFAQGLAGALGQAQAVSTVGPFGATSSITGDAALRAAGLSGAQGAANQLAQFYLKEAQSIFPVISVDGGRRATVVFTEDAALEWGSSEAKFVREVKPE
jgi:conjugal transfer pilus assembly protein TraB